MKGVVGMKLAVGGGGFLTQGLADPSSVGDSTRAWWPGVSHPQAPSGHL